jgi:GT2 family glycosyltransferase
MAMTDKPISHTPDQQKVGVVILNWNHASLTLRCVEHVLAQDGVAAAVSVIVVDNGSGRDDIAVLEAGLPPTCWLICNEVNRGFAGGMNVGIDVAVQQGCSYVWALNNDAFAEPGCLAALVNSLDRDERLAAVTPRLLNPDRTPQVLGSQIDWDTGELTALRPGELPTTTSWYVTGAAIFVRTKALENERAFDERFFAYWEDADLCVRLLDRQWHLAVIDSAVCVHLGSASSGIASPFVSYLMTRNVSLFLQRHRSRTRWLGTWLRYAALQLVHAAGVSNAGADASARAILAGLADGFRGRFGRPIRLSPSDRVVGVVLRHYWALARTFWATAYWLSPRTWRRRSESALPFAAVLDGRFQG